MPASEERSVNRTEQTQDKDQNINNTDTNRMRVLIPAAVTVAGIVATISGYLSATPSNHYTIWYGPSSSAVPARSGHCWTASTPRDIDV